MYSFRLATESDKPAWESFVTNHLHGSVHQSWDWKALQETIPGREQVVGLVVEKEGVICALTWCVMMYTGVGKHFWFYSPRGPVGNEEACLFLVNEGRKILKDMGALFWRLDPYWTQETAETFWSKLSNIFKPAQGYQPTDTLMLDLSLDNEALLAQMKRKGRYNINQAKKHGIEIQKYQVPNIPEWALNAFWDLNQATTSRDGFSGHEKSYYQSFLKSLSETAWFYVAVYEGRVLAAAINTVYAKKAIYYFGASTSDNEDRKKMAPYLLQWQMIQDARDLGGETYDFLGIAPEGKLNHAYAGITEFKLKFGGERVVYDAGREIALNSLWYFIYRCVKWLKN